MSDIGEIEGLVRRPIFDRVASSLNAWIKQGSIEFRFIRGGTFRASVIKERLSTVLTSLDVDKTHFDRTLSEIVVYLNAAIFDLSIDAVLSQMRIQMPRFAASTKDDASAAKELESRFEYVTSNVELDILKSRAHLRQNATSLTYDDVSWSVTRGTIAGPGEQSVPVESVGVILSLFLPGLSQPSAMPFGFNLIDLATKSVEKIAFTLDETDVDDLLAELTKAKRAMRAFGRK